MEDRLLSLVRNSLFSIRVFSDSLRDNLDYWQGATWTTWVSVRHTRTGAQQGSYPMGAAGKVTSV